MNGETKIIVGWALSVRYVWIHLFVLRLLYDQPALKYVQAGEGPAAAQLVILPIYNYRKMSKKL